MPPVTLPYCVQIIQALGPTLIAIVALLVTGYFAWRQWNTARDKLRLDLFDKRYAYFVVFRDFMISVIQNGDARHDDLDKFWRGMVGAEFVFDKETAEYIDSIGKRAMLLGAKNRLLENLDLGEQRGQMADDAANIFMSINDEFPALEKKFVKSMNLGGL